MEQDKNQEVDTTKPESESSSNADIEAIQLKLARLEQTNERLLNESKDWKSKYQETKTAISEREAKELEKKENWKELLDREREKRISVEDKFNSTKKEIIRNKLELEIAKYAQDAHNPSKVLNLLPKNLLKVDEENLSISGVKEAIELLRKEDGYLFKNVKMPTMVNQKPVTGEPKAKSPEEMSSSERKQALASAFEQLLKK